MKLAENILELTPKGFEKAVQDHLNLAGVKLEQFKTHHLEKIKARDGEYVIDVTARFSALGGDYLCLIECKKEKRPVERQDVQVLHTKMKSIVAQKGYIFATGGFQRGAIVFAREHGIATILVSSGGMYYRTRSQGKERETGAQGISLWDCGLSNEKFTYSVITNREDALKSLQLI